MKATTVNKIGSTWSIIVFSLVLVFGIAFLSLFLKFGNKSVPENYIEAQAKITEIKEELLPGINSADIELNPESYDHYVFIEYTYNDKTYSDCEFDSYNSDMKVGDSVQVFINPEKPAEFMSNPSGNIIFIFIGIGVIILGAGGIVFNVFKRIRG